MTAGGDTVKIKNKSDIVNMMNRQFSQMGEKLAEKLECTSATYSDYLPEPNPNTSNLNLEPAS